MFNNKKAEFNLQGMLFGLLFVGLIAAVLGSVINLGGGNYNTEGYNDISISKYNSLSNISEDLRDVESDTDTLVVEKDIFDYFAGIWNKLTGPFKTVYRSYKTLQSLTSDAVDDLNLLPVFKDFATLAIIVLVIIGIIMIKFYLGKRK